MNMNQLAQTIFWLSLIVSVAICWRYGEKPELAGSAIMVGGAILSVAAVSDFVGSFTRIEYGLIAVDVAVLVALYALMLRSNRFWPIWASAFQTAAMLTHATTVLAPATVPAGYALLQGFWAYPVIGSMLAGVFGQLQAVKQSAK
jgi:Flp pilus assembly pilin Flp